MSKQANPTLVGAFVVGAVALAAAGIVIFGGHNLFEPEFKYVAYFETSVTGLDVGAAVRYRGVQVGRVSNIQAVWSEDEEEILIPVELTLSKGAVRASSQDSRELLDRRGVADVMESLIARGLRAVLVQDSFLTGKLHVALNHYPGSEVRIVGGSELPEIPTLRAGLERVAQRFEELPIDELVASVIDAMAAIEALATKPELGDLFVKLDTLVERLDAQIEPLASSTEALIADLRGASAQLSGLIQDVDAEVGRVSGAATGALDESRATLEHVNALIGEKDIVVYRLAVLLEELGAAARALRVLAETLERQPEALIKGKGER
jgi:paraquat-inducible protein B